MKNLFAFATAILRRIFHKRSVIIISRHQTNHLDLSGPLQFAAFAGVVACVSLASYSTGSYMSARSVMHAQEQTLKSVANSRIDTSFDYTMAKLEPSAREPVSPAYALSLADPAYALPTASPAKLFARIAILEDKVKSLRAANVEIIQAVRERTRNQIAGMESLIRSTGLDPEALKGSVQQHKAAQAAASGDADSEQAGQVAGEGGQGGPFIPLEMADASPYINGDLAYKLDQVAMLDHIIGDLPLGKPLKDANMESNFGRRVDPFTGRLAFHPGVDISGPVGSEVQATAAGKVIAAGWAGAYGNCVDIDHGYGISTRYAHMSALRVKVGEEVKAGQVVGIQGSTGRSTGPHVHYEVRYNNKPLDPTNFLSAGYHVSQNDQ